MMCWIIRVGIMSGKVRGRDRKIMRHMYKHFYAVSLSDCSVCFAGQRVIETRLAFYTNLNNGGEKICLNLQKKR